MGTWLDSINNGKAEIRKARHSLNEIALGLSFVGLDKIADQIGWAVADLSDAESQIEAGVRQNIDEALGAAKESNRNLVGAILAGAFSGAPKTEA